MNNDELSPEELIHVTRVDEGAVYGHTTDHCDPAGCAGYEYLWADIHPDENHDIQPGDIIEAAGDRF